MPSSSSKPPRSSSSVSISPPSELTSAFDLLPYGNQLIVGDFIERAASVFYVYNNKKYGSEVLLLSADPSIEGPLTIIQRYTFSDSILSSYSQESVIYLLKDNGQIVSIDFRAYAALRDNTFMYSEIDPAYLIRTYSFVDGFNISEIRGAFRAENTTGLIVMSLLIRRQPDPSLSAVAPRLPGAV
jgi:hypothetical protein